MIVEIGSYLGASAAAMGAGLRAVRNDVARIYCVDTWCNDAMSEGFRDTFEQFSRNTAAYVGLLVPMRGRSADVAHSIAEKVSRIDLLFIDGDHSYEGCREDWLAYRQMLGPGARVAFHDVGWAAGVQRVVNEDVRPRVRRERMLPNLWWGELA